MKATMTENETTVDGFLKTVLELNLLRSMAGKSIFCATCNAIMDCRRTVVATIHGNMPGKAERILSQYVCCGSCFDKRRHFLDEGIETVHRKHPQASIRMEIVDGRESRFDDVES